MPAADDAGTVRSDPSPAAAQELGHLGAALHAGNGNADRCRRPDARPLRPGVIASERTRWRAGRQPDVHAQQPADGGAGVRRQPRRQLAEVIVVIEPEPVVSSPATSRSRVVPSGSARADQTGSTRVEHGRNVFEGGVARWATRTRRSSVTAARGGRGMWLRGRQQEALTREPRKPSTRSVRGNVRRNAHGSARFASSTRPMWWVTRLAGGTAANPW